MKKNIAKSWEDFEEKITIMSKGLDQFRKTKKPLRVSNLIFRGQSDASWSLETTLERFTKGRFRTKEYFETIRAVRPAVISLTNKEWGIPETFDTEQDVPPGYEFMIYLRHHGFPSPLLDWTRSPYVAAFFAFRPNETPQNGSAAIYAYAEYVGEAKGQTLGTPSIHGLGPYVISHRRHYAQQCEYTICKVRNDEGDFYTSHEGAISKSESGGHLLIKFVLPWTEREKVMKMLHRMNVTAFSLFGSEESLMETLAYQEIGKDRGD